MNRSEHLSTGFLARAMDDELSPADRGSFDSHLAACEACRSRYHELGVLSVRLEAVVNRSTQEDSSRDSRDLLEQELIRRGVLQPPRTRSGKIAQRVGWSMAIAASLALGVMFIPHRQLSVRPQVGSETGSLQPATFELDGETFFTLPYSNAELPVATSHVVQMQVPVSSLTDAGVFVQPVSSQAGDPDAAVLADVLLGVDGEPLGVHVIGTE